MRARAASVDGFKTFWAELRRDKKIYFYREMPTHTTGTPPLPVQSLAIAGVVGTAVVSVDEDTDRSIPDESGTVLELHFASEAAANVHLLGAIFGEASTSPSRADLPREGAATSPCAPCVERAATRPGCQLAAPQTRPAELDRARRVTGSHRGSLGRPRGRAQQASARRGEVEPDASPPRGAVRANNVWQLNFDSVTELQAWRADIERLKVGRPSPSPRHPAACAAMVTDPPCSAT